MLNEPVAEPNERKLRKGDALTTLAEFQAHAKKYGTESVMEVAIEAGLSHDQLCSLLKTCDDVEAKAAKRFQTPRKRRLTVKQRVDRLLGLEEDGSAESGE